MKVSLYARISTSNGSQQLATQLLELRKYARRMKWQVVAEFTDEITGTSFRRPGLDRLMEAATRHEFDTVLVFSLSRLTRSGPASAFQLIERLRACQVEIWSMTEEHFRTTGAAGPLLIAIAAFLAQQEREQLVARVNAGLARAKASGTKLGRRKVLVDRTKLIALRNTGSSIRQIARILKTSRCTIARALAAQAVQL